MVVAGKARHGCRILPRAAISSGSPVSSNRCRPGAAAERPGCRNTRKTDRVAADRKRCCKPVKGRIAGNRAGEAASVNPAWPWPQAPPMNPRNKNKNRAGRIASALLLILSLTACGGGGGGGGGDSTTPPVTGGGNPPPVVLSGNFFPTTIGATWRFTTSNSSAPDLLQVAGTTTTNGLTAYDFVSTSGADGSVGHDLYVVDANGVRDYVSPTETDPVARALSGIQVPALSAYRGRQLPAGRCHGRQRGRLRR